ncbi:GNAT family N-acetyltransferase [Xanthovirga aplysinae]|uniref:GNAT family N-acetyltransferase n=1 Tax=Xanthovirga aplysinae TaxID=2529853 RepID=UPI0012BCB1C6|nr:GNAT family N-acetyltransferase [Xanthovirga aplysinae]MTI30254.1 GNAT family N-acetyltransferase [Xanthovirga aplysinae]
MKIRFAEREDIDQVVNLIGKHAAFEKAEFNSQNKSNLLSIHLFNSQEVLKCIVAEENNEIVGYATFMKQYSTWEADFYIYLDCLFLIEEMRGRGIGLKMMNQVKDFAKAEGCQLIQWQTPDFNKDAIAFYHRLGGTSKTKERFFWIV